MKKVLLIGLGGTGCAVVSQVKRMVAEAEGQRGEDPTIKIRFLGFDTDSNQEDAPELHVVRTSRSANVQDMLRREPNWQEWFPYHPMLMNRNMVDGAGQIRVLSRLAFSDMLRHPESLTDLDEVLRELNAEEGEEADKLKIMIVSSFAGGTGSGMFIQMPLFLRAYIEKHYPGMQVIIRGLFALPDVFMGQRHNQIQRESMYANAYASLKELAAINRICLADDTDNSMAKYDIQIEGLFDSRKILSGDKQFAKTGVIPAISKAGLKPYDFIFFVDDINANRNRLNGEMGAYLGEMAKITYMQVYAPMMSTADSREDNLITTTMVSEGDAMYGSAGSAKLVYPYGKILLYCAYRTVDDMLRSQWQAIDDKYREKVQELKNKSRTDVTVQIPPRSDDFIAQVNKYLKDKNHHFAFLQNGLFDVRVEKKGSKGNPISVPKQVARENTYLKCVDDYILESYRSDPALSDKHDGCEYNKEDDLGKAKDEIEGSVEANEMAMEEYYHTIDDRVSNMYFGIVDAIIPQKLGGQDDDSSKQYNIRNLLSKPDENNVSHAIHPLSARYLLYSLQKSIRGKIEEAKNAMLNQKDEIEKYWTEDLNPRTKDEVEKWYQVVPAIGLARKGFLKKYAAAAAGQRTNLNEYGKQKLLQNVYSLMSERIGALILRYEKVFGALDHVSEVIEKMIVETEEAFSTEEVSEIYMCASHERLEDLYSSLTLGEGNAENSGIFDELLSEVYMDAMTDLERAAQKKKIVRDEEKYLNELFGQSVLDMFTEKVIPFYVDELRTKCDDKLNIDAYEALEIQAKEEAEKAARIEGRTTRLTAKDYEKARRQLLAKVYRKAAPYLLSLDYHEPDQEVGNDDGSTDSHEPLYWGVSEKVFQEMETTKGAAEKYMKALGSSTPELNASRMYSDYELCCYRAAYSIRLTEIPKFRESDDESLQGEFYRNYAARIQKMVKGRNGKILDAITPHLDIRWHTKQYLPSISGARNNAEDSKAARAMWLAMIYGEIYFKPVQGKQQAWVRFVRPRKNNPSLWEAVYNERPLTYDGQYLVRSTQAYELFKAFQQDDTTVNQAIDVLDPIVEQECKRIVMGKSFTGPRSERLTRMLIGSPDEEKQLARNSAAKQEIIISEEDAEEYKKATAFSVNALTFVNRIINYHLATEEEERTVIEALWSILEEIQDAGLYENRFMELLSDIFENSPYIYENQRDQTALNMVLNPYFSDAMDLYDRTHEKTRIQSSSEAKKPATKKAATTKASTSRKPSATKAPATKKATATGKTTATKASATKKATASKTTTAKKASAGKTAAKKTSTKKA